MESAEEGNPTSITGLIVGETSSPAKADAVAGRFALCPYIALTAASGKTVVALYAVPSDMEWWLKLPVARPEIMGLSRAECFISCVASATSPFVRGETERNRDTSPCGSTGCGDCEWFGKGCGGCPVLKPESVVRSPKAGHEGGVGT